MSNLEELFALQIRALQLPAPVREYKFHPKRRWRLDFAWPDDLIAVEVEGGVWTGGRHSTGVGFTIDCEKYAEAMCLGWRILRVTGSQVENGQAIDWLIRVFTVKTR
jgi:very-short-patch-repair endonuclease